MTEPPEGPPGPVRAGFESAPPVLVVLEGDPLRVSACNAAGRDRLGVQVGDSAQAVLDVTGLNPVAPHLAAVLDGGAPAAVTGLAADLLDLDGLPDRAMVDVEVAPVHDALGEVEGVVLSCTESTPAGPGTPGPAGVPVDLPAGTEAAQQLVTRLQDAVTDEGLPLPPGVELAAHYLIAEHDGGGDFFDAIALDDGRVVLVVGDVTGHGLDATVVAGEVRAVFDELVRSSGDLGAALESLDRRAQRAPSSRAATMCAVLLDPASGELTYCTAGFAPPLVVSHDGTPSYLPPSAASPLGMGRPFPVARHRLSPGDLLVLYSDGLVARPGLAPEEATLSLLRQAATVTSRPAARRDDRRAVDAFTYGLLEAATRQGYFDDVTLLGARLVEAVPPLTLRMDAAASTVRDVRRALGTWLDRLQVRAIDESALQHSVGELVCNAVEHGHGVRLGVDDRDDARPDRAAGRVDVVATHLPDGSIEVTVDDDGSWRSPTRTSERGRGLAMVRGLCDEFELTTTADGTHARLKHRPSWDVTLLTGQTLDPSPHEQTPLEVSVPRDGLLLLRGRVESTAVDRLHHILGQHSQGGTLPLLVDLSEVTMLSSAAIHVLATAQSWTASLRLVAPVGSPSQQLLDRAGLPHLSGSTGDF